MAEPCRTWARGHRRPPKAAQRKGAPGALPPFQAIMKRSCRRMRLSPERRLRRGEAGDRDAERRARHVVEMRRLAEGDRGRIAAVLAADAELDVGPRRPAALDGDLDQFADADGVDA